MTKINDDLLSNLTLEVSFEHERVYDPKDMREEPDAFFQILNGKISLTVTDDDGDPIAEKVIGAFRLKFINGQLAVDHRANLYEIFDIEQETLEFYEDVIDPTTNEYKKNIEKALDWDLAYFQKTILIVDRLGVLPEYRNKKIGLYVLRNIIERFSIGAGIVALKPAVFPFENKHIENNEPRWDTGDDRIEAPGLIKFYKKQGFVQIPDSKFMALCTEKRLPAI